MRIGNKGWYGNRDEKGGKRAGKNRVRSERKRELTGALGRVVHGTHTTVSPLDKLGFFVSVDTQTIERIRILVSFGSAHKIVVATYLTLANGATLLAPYTRPFNIFN